MTDTEKALRDDIARTIFVSLASNHEVIKSIASKYVAVAEKGDPLANYVGRSIAAAAVAYANEFIEESRA